MRCSILKRRPSAWVRSSMSVALLACSPSAGATVFPEGIEYNLEAEAIGRYESNPFRFSNNSPEQDRSSMVLHSAVRGGLVVPLLSERTRLEMSGTYGKTKYSRFRQLDHDPAHLDTALYWSAGRLLTGSVSYMYDNRLYPYLERTWPNRNMTATRRWSTVAGLKLSDSLTFPWVSLSSTRVTYEDDETAMFFNRRVHQAQLSARYAGMQQSSMEFGARTIRADYFDRTPDWIELIDRRYREREIFGEVTWQPSHRTSLHTALAHRKRAYDALDHRDVNMPYFNLKLGWRYSIITRFDFAAWHYSYANDEDPEALYGTVTAGRAQVRWQPSDKTWVSLALTHEREIQTLISGERGRERTTWRLGPRFEWQANPNVRFILDGWHDHTRRESSGGGFKQTVVRFGIVLITDNGYKRPSRIQWHPECDPPRPLETLACQP